MIAVESLSCLCWHALQPGMEWRFLTESSRSICKNLNLNKWSHLAKIFSAELHRKSLKVFKHIFEGLRNVYSTELYIHNYTPLYKFSGVLSYVSKRDDPHNPSLWLNPVQWLWQNSISLYIKCNSSSHEVCHHLLNKSARKPFQNI